MAEEDAQPQIYLVTPPEIELESFPATLARVLDSREIACLRLALATREEDRLIRAADTLREIAHARDIAVTIEAHVGLAEQLGLDGVHLTDAARSVRRARRRLGPEAVVGAQCGASCDAGMSAAEAGADYVSFGPVAASALFDGTVAGEDLFAWWAEMIKVPVVAEGALSAETVAALAPVTDFLAVGEEIWREEHPDRALRTLLALLG